MFGLAAKMITVALVFFACAILCCAVSEHDLSLHLYTEAGEIAQVSYAATAIQRSTSKVVFRDRGLGIITMLSIRKREPSLCTNRMKSVEAIKDLPLVCISAGYAPDCRYLLNQFNQLVQNHCFLYGESPNAEYVKHHLSRWMTRGLYDSEEDPVSRPLAAAVAIAAYDHDTNSNKLVEIHNNGYAEETSLAILGGLSPQTRQKIAMLCEDSHPAAAATVAPTNVGNVEDKNSWEERCRQCLDVLLEASKGSLGGDEDNEEDGAYCVECCVVGPAGALHQPAQDLPSVAATVQWLRSLP